MRRSVLCWILLEYVCISAASLDSGFHVGTDGSNPQLHDLGSVTGSISGRSSAIRTKSPALSFPSNDSVSCEDLEGAGSFNTTCLLSANLYLSSDLSIYGLGNIEILPHVYISCLIEGCTINFNVSGYVRIGQNAAILAGSLVFSAANMTLENGASINTTSFGGAPPSQTSGTPVGYDGAGGGHGGRGASCVKSNTTSFWGGDVYSWSNLSEPWSYGSKGGGTSDKKQFGGNGGGRIKLLVKDLLYLNGSVLAEGGDGGLNGGGGSGGSIFMHAVKLKGYGTISAAGGRGWGGGGGGRISLDCYSIQEDIRITVDQVLAVRIMLEQLVRGQISLYRDSSIIFGLSDFPVSEFELVAEELLMSDSIIKVYGALRVAVKMLLMWNSEIQIDGGGNTVVTTSVLEVRNLVVLRHNSIIRSNTNLAVYGQGLLKLTGHGDAIKGQRLSLSLFYNITVGPGAKLQAPWDDDASRSVVTKSLCESQTCPTDIITPPDDCHVNYTLSFSLQICRVEDILVTGLIKGSIIHIHRARTVIIDPDGMITASELGCSDGIGRGNYTNGAGSGAGHGGRGGTGYYNGIVCNGGLDYGSADLPCELGSGTEGPNQSYGHMVGGGMIVMGSTQWPLLKLEVYGFLRANGQGYTRTGNTSLLGRLGGASGGTILLFLQEIKLVKNSSLSVLGGKGGSFGGGGGGGGRVHFHWSKIDVGEEYVPIATIEGSIDSSGGAGANGSSDGEKGTITGKRCPKGLYGTFCKECPVGTYKNVDGSDASLCTPCSLDLLPRRAYYIYVRGGVRGPSCPYKCISDKYRMPKCYNPVEELMYTFGGPLPFALLLSCLLVLLALLLSTLRIKVVGPGCGYYKETPNERHSHHHFPYLLSLSEVRGARAEETQSHVHRMYFMGPNTFREPWHLPYSPPDSVIDIVYEDAFNRFIDEINSVAAYDWSRALYKGMKVGATPDLIVAYIDFFLGGDEKRLDIVSIIEKRFPMCILFGGDGSYMSPYSIHSDILLTNLLGQHVPATVWNRLVAGLNAQLRTVRHGSIRTSLRPVLDWINSHGNPQLEFHGVKIDLGWFQATASGYYQLGILVSVGDFSLQTLNQYPSSERNDECSRKNDDSARKGIKHPQQIPAYSSHVLARKRITGGINGGVINDATLRSLQFKRDYAFPMCLLLRNMRPIGHQDTTQYIITVMLLADLSVTLLTLLLYYWISLGAFLAVLLVLPLSLLSPFPAGLNALFSKEPRRALLARVYALWNAASLSNIIVAFICGIIYYGISSFQPPSKSNSSSSKRDDDQWWLFPTILVFFKAIQARFVDWHVANLEVQDLTLFDSDPNTFWAHESS
ncbi:hypothetical protein CDL15_Pgr003721 [Punica granatum]|uniref:DUF8003 domain-containing protein n=1 Tax=Punica granatum TaxID=22663 RepID=A0A218XUM8_PUNGR|nr:hypothetical protein CDL15_Pgr003721 [Punica granatum]